MDWCDRKFEAVRVLMEAGGGTSRVRFMDDLKESRMYRWMGTRSICLTVNM